MATVGQWVEGARPRTVGVAVAPVLVGMVAADGYTGGRKPYGYLGFGELMVLLCFGFAATAGSAYVQTKHVNGDAWIGCLVVGLPAVAILLANNIRDIPTDRVAGKRTL